MKSKPTVTEKQPRVRVIPYSKEDKERAKFMTEIINHMMTPEEWELARKLAVLDSLSDGRAYISWDRWWRVKQFFRKIFKLSNSK